MLKIAQMKWVRYYEVIISKLFDGTFLIPSGNNFI